MEALVAEEGITRKSVIQKLSGIKAALAKGQEPGDNDNTPSSIAVETPTKKRKLSASKPAGKKMKTEQDDKVEAKPDEERQAEEPDARPQNEGPPA
ncbi:hypothetical protein ABW21_db0207477 [Orbilia brochopaga]|nr:hypothetical protein ABW21_db0207477 [Drechslerella brochopaga]